LRHGVAVLVDQAASHSQGDGLALEPFLLCFGGKINHPASALGANN
jgi:hypothetical protein